MLKTGTKFMYSVILKKRHFKIIINKGEKVVVAVNLP
jgi:hypothetical protein